MEKKAALYARVSTARQEQAATIESQVAELESYAQEQGYEIDPELIFLDQAVSGSRLARPALDRLRDLAYEGGLGVLITHLAKILTRQGSGTYLLFVGDLATPRQEKAIFDSRLTLHLGCQ